MPAQPMPASPNIYKLVDPIWEQQPNESRRHYTMFLQFAALRPSERNLRLAWKMWTHNSSKEGKPVSNYYRVLANNWRWTERAAAKDFHDAQNMQAKWIERDKERREDAFELGSKLVRQSKRVLNIVERLPDDELNISLSEAKDLAVAGTTLQNNAIPSIQLAADQMQWLLGALPPEKRNEIIKRLTQPKEEILLLNDGNTVDAEYSMVETNSYNQGGYQTYGDETEDDEEE